jgi:hypothetical protein
MTGYQSKKAAALDEEGMYLVHQTQPAQKPVAWGVFEGNLHDMFFSQKEAQEMADLKGIHAEVRPLYTAPPQRPWVGLTDEQIAYYLGDEYHAMTESELRFFRLGEAAAKEKNT